MAFTENEKCVKCILEAKENYTETKVKVFLKVFKAQI